MKNPLRNAVFGLVVAVVAALAFLNAGTAGGTSTARNKLTLIAPAAPALMNARAATTATTRPNTALRRGFFIVLVP